MKGFRDELMADLLASAGSFLDIKYLTDRYCGEDNTFQTGDDTKVKARLGINTVLRELEKMGWINLHPKGGLSTMHSFNQSLGKRQFLMDYAVKARLTTLGEIEYGRLKKDEEKPTPTIQVGGNFSGILSTGHVTSSPVTHVSDSGDVKADIKSNTPKKTSSKPSMTLLKVIGAILIIVAGILKAFGVI